VAVTDAWVLERGTAGYPPSLLDLDGLRSTGSPDQLFGRGRRELVAGWDSGRAITIVGARRSTAYGRSMAAELAGSLAAAGMVVVSGMAYGIDQAAHRGALEAGGETLAVLACGPDRAYPPSARALYRRVLAAGGAVVSEAPPGYRPFRSDFPKRNRIMAALTAMTVMVEARDPSGSRITADVALELGRDVGGMPGPIGSPLSAGPHALIRDGAQLIRGAQDILDGLLGVGALTAKRIGPELDAECERALGAVGSGTGLSDVAAGAGLDAARGAVALARLELLGYVRAEAGRYARTGLVPP
jgi:DNA processing protein